MSPANNITWDSVYVGMYSFPSLARLPVSVEEVSLGDRLSIIEH